VWVLGPPPQLAAQIAPSQLQEGSLALADRRRREGGWVTVSKTIASEQHLRIGGPVRLPTPAGYAGFRLAATTANYGWLPGAVVMNGADHARLWAGGDTGRAGSARQRASRSTNGTDGAPPASGEATQLAVTLAPGVPLARGKRLVQAALPAGSGLSVQSAGERRAEVSAVLGSTLSRLNATTIVVIVTTIASVIALMMAAVWQGRARFDSLISIGMGFGQFARLIFYESGTVLFGGCLIGVAAGLTGQYLIDGWLAHTTGSPVHYAAAWQAGLRTLAIALAISLAASLAAVIRISGSQPRAAFSAQ
jgi:putative ABC transport system permease protein